MQPGNIILLNGVSSSGKSTLARALVEQLPGYFYLSIDDFDLLIDRMEDRKKQRLIPVETEYFFHKTIALFAERGINLVVDHILHDDFTQHDIFEALAEFPIFFVGVQCPLEELERREQLRGDRRIGQARQQLKFVHRIEVYDVVVDTTCDVQTCVGQVLAVLQTGDFPKGWRLTQAKLLEQRVECTETDFTK